MPLIKELPYSERPRERMLSQGAGMLSNTELLAILIGTGTRNESAMSLAEQIISKEEEGLHFLGSAVPQELSEISGVGEAKSCQIAAAIELGKRLATKPRAKRLNIGSPEDIASIFMEEIRYHKKESFKILLLNKKNEIISVEDISTGNIDTSIVDPREVFNPAIRKSAGSIVLVHNHPSGNPEPSNADIKVTERIKKAGEILDIKVVDHIIIGDGTFISFKRKKLI